MGATAVWIELQPVGTRMPTCSRRRAHSLLVLLALLAAAACGGDKAVGPGTPRPQPADTDPTTLILGSSVSAAARANIHAVLSARDSTDLRSGGTVYLPKGASKAAVIAVNGEGQALLAGLAKPRATDTLDATSTALVLLKELLPPTLLILPPDSTLEAQIRANQGFPALEKTIQSLADAGQSYTTSDIAVAEAETIIESLMATLGTAPNAQTAMVRQSTLSDARNTIRFTKVPIDLAATGTAVQFTNHAAVGFAVSVSGTVRESISLPAVEWCLLCVPPSFGTPKSVSIGGLADGQYTATADMGKDQENAVIVQIPADLVLATLRLAGFSIESQVESQMVGLVASKLDFQNAFAMSHGDPTEMLKALANQMVAALPDLVTALVANIPKLSATSATILILKNLAGPLTKLDFAVWAGGRAAIYTDLVRYFGISDQTSFCLDSGALYPECVARVTVTPDAPTIGLGKTATLTALVSGTDGQPITDRTLSWSTNDPSVATVVGQTATTALVTGRSQGVATITVSVGARQAKSTVTVATAVTTIYSGSVSWFGADGKYDGTGWAFGATFHVTRLGDGSVEGVVNSQYENMPILGGSYSATTLNFTVQEACGVYTFSGTVASDGSVSGPVSVAASKDGCGSRHGTFSLKP